MHYYALLRQHVLGSSNHRLTPPTIASCEVSVDKDLGANKPFTSNWEFPKAKTLPFSLLGDVHVTLFRTLKLVEERRTSWHFYEKKKNYNKEILMTYTHKEF